MKDLNQVYTLLKVVGVSISILTAAVAVGVFKSTVNADSTLLSRHGADIQLLKDRQTHLEDTLADLPEMKSDIKKLLIQMELLNAQQKH